MVAGAIASQSNLTLAPDPDADITRAIELWEQGNELLLLSGRLFAQAKEQAKRKFTKLLEGASLEKSQVSKLIKGAESADEIPSTVAAKLGLPMLVQLGQPRNQTAREAIAYEDTQLLVAQKIKELRTPTQPKDDAPVRFVGKKEAKLRIEVPAGPTAVELKQDWEVSGLSPLEWLSKRVQRSAPKQELIALVPLVEDAVAVGTQDISEPTIAQSELVVTVNQAEDEFDEIVQQTNSTTLINEVEVGSANECGTIEVQDEVLSNPSTITEVIGGSVTETQGETAPTKNQSCAATATPTDRYKQGWNVGDSAIPNSVGGEYFVNWCGGQPVLIESVSGLAGEIQTLRVARSDGQTDMSFGNWLESVEHTQASTVQALANTTFKIQEVELVETPDLTKLTKALLKAKNWDKVSQLVTVTLPY